MIPGIAVVVRRALALNALALAFAACALLPSPLSAQEPQIPAPTGVVNDFAGVLDAATIARMQRIAEDVRAKSRGEIAIVTLPDLKGRDVADVALRIGREWKVGKIGDPGDPTRNAGAVILLVPKETNSDNRGRCYIATGQGAEGFITDATAGDICREATPGFIQRDYAGGLELVTRRTAERFAREFNFTIDSSLVPPVPVRPARERSGRGIPPIVIFIIFFVVLSMLSSATRRGRKGRRDGCGSGVPLIIPIGGGRSSGSWGGGGFGGGGGGFGGFGGGGGFSGGGGGSSW